MIIADRVLREMWRLLCEHNPKEVCGVLYPSDPYNQPSLSYDRLHVMINYAPDPTKEFWMNPEELRHLFFEVVPPIQTIMLWHSHPTSRWNLSPQDCKVMRATSLPMAVVAVQPYPSVVVYDFHSTSTARCIRMVEQYRIPPEVPHGVCEAVQ